MNDNGLLAVTDPRDMIAVLQGRCAQLMAGLNQFPAVSATQIKDHIASMYGVADILEDAVKRLQAEAESEGAGDSGEDRAH